MQHSCADPVASSRPSESQTLPLTPIRPSPAFDVVPEAEAWTLLGGQQFLIALQGVGHGHLGGLGVLMAVPGCLGGGLHERVEDRLALLCHLDGERLGAAAPLEHLDIELDGVESRRAEEMAVEARWTLNLRDRAGGAQRDGREVAAVGAPDLPRLGEVRDVPAVLCFDPRRLLEI